MPALTYDSYPNIVDAVIRQSAFTEQLTLRLVCSSFRLAVDRHQVHHLVLTPLHDGARVCGPVHRVAALSKIGPLSWSAQPEHPKRDLASYVRVIDVRGYFPASVDLSLLRSSFGHLSTVRMTTENGAYTPYVPFEAETLVLFTSPEGGICNPKPEPSAKDSYMDRLMGQFGRIMDDSDEEDEGPVMPASVPPLSERTCKIVVNMSGDDYPVADMWRCALDPPPHIRDIVVVLPRYVAGTFEAPTGGRGHGMGLLGETTFAENLVAKDLAELMVGVPHVRYAVVGVEDIPWPKARFRRLVRSHLAGFQFGSVEYGADTPTVECSLETGQKTVLPKTPAVRAKHEAKVDEVLQRLSCLTFDEYAAAVGRETVKVETLEYLDGTERPARRGILLNDIRRMGPAARA